KIGDEVDLQNATDYCINNGIDIINHSVGWYNTNYYDGTGVVAGTANSARDQGGLWVNAAGNDADGVNGYTGHWQGGFLDVDGDNWHEFALGDERNSFYLASGDTITILMTWDDWVYSDQNYDLYLYNPVGTQVRSSLDWQTGTQHPTEWIEYTATSNGRHSFAIYRLNAPSSPEIEVFLWNKTGPALGLEYNTYESSIVTPANSAKVLTVGAIYYGNWTTGPQEAFSSQGPSNTSKYAASRTKPDVMGPDGTSNYTYGSFPGTSAASPHVAGAAALLLSEDPTRTADQLQAKLEGDAIGMGAGGKDNIYGSGRLNLVLGPVQPLVGHWRFNEGTGSTVGDSSGLGNDGVIHGASWTHTSPDGSWALSFDGVNDYVEAPDAASLDVMGAITIEAWIQPAVNLPDGAAHVLVSKRGSGYELKISKKGYLLLYINNGVAVRTGLVPLNAGTWYYIAASYVSGTSNGHIYLDQVDVTSSVTPLTLTTNNRPLVIGRQANTGDTYFRGVMDEVRIHNVVHAPDNPVPSS
ncbi:S8 family serine peptidase, partial [Candidatus Bipolaricaulota bacterium]|nr:S8 family serine peptidase [Candidatus Bipolaricaulota bacterium]